MLPRDLRVSAGCPNSHGDRWPTVDQFAVSGLQVPSSLITRISVLGIALPME
jgi:hypothetical protein